MLYLVRHGENLANITKEFSYKLVDYSLTPKGVLQAEQTSTLLKDLPLDAVYASPLKRAAETGEIIARPHHLPVEIVEDFREINVGDLEKMPPTLENWNRYGQIYTEWGNGHPEKSFPGGENFLELIERSRRGLLTATHERSNQRILIAAHGGIFIAMVSYFCQGANEQFDYRSMHNCSITEVELTNSAGEIHGILRSWASISHLSGEAADLVKPTPEEYERV
jgi:broad specificity phosphatase PhoE